MWKFANWSKPAGGKFEKLCFIAKQMNGIDDDQFWSKRSSWEQPKYDRVMKINEVLRKMKSNFHIALCGEWQLIYKIPEELRQSYSIIQRELYGGKYPNPLKSFINSVSHHTLSKLVQLRTYHDYSGNIFPNKIHHQAKSLLQAWSTGNSRFVTVALLFMVRLIRLAC